MPSRIPGHSQLPVPQSAATPPRASKLPPKSSPRTPSRLPMSAKSIASPPKKTFPEKTTASTPTRLPRLDGPKKTTERASKTNPCGLSHARSNGSEDRPSSSELSLAIPQTTPPTMNPHSPYMFDSIADACVKGSLIHKLACGHKVITVKAETCAANCCRPLPNHVLKFANSHLTEDHFACPGCVEEHVKLHISAKRAVLTEMIHNAERKLVKLPPEYVNARFRRGEAEWEEDAKWERSELLGFGRKCRYIADGDPNYQQFFLPREPVSVAVAWPPKKGPKRARSPGYTASGVAKVKRLGDYKQCAV